MHSQQRRQSYLTQSRSQQLPQPHAVSPHQPQPVVRPQQTFAQQDPSQAPLEIGTSAMNSINSQKGDDIPTPDQNQQSIEPRQADLFAQLRQLAQMKQEMERKQADQAMAESNAANTVAAAAEKPPVKQRAGNQIGVNHQRPPSHGGNQGKPNPPRQSDDESDHQYVKTSSNGTGAGGETFHQRKRMSEQHQKATSHPKLVVDTSQPTHDDTPTTQLQSTGGPGHTRNYYSMGGNETYQNHLGGSFAGAGPFANMSSDDIYRFN